MGALAAPAFVTVLSIGSSGCGDDGTQAGGSGAPGVTFSVDPAVGHIHSFTIPQAVLDNPPAAGYTALTSNVNAHTHQIVLTQNEVMDIAASMAVMGTTGAGGGHTHGFTFP
jgi:hypothetical protein